MKEGQDLNELAKKAKEQLQRQSEQVLEENTGEPENIYASFMKDDVDSDSNKENTDVEVIQDVHLRNIPNEHIDNPTLNNIQTEDYRESYEPILPVDEPLFPDGPTKTMVESWKKQWVGYEIYVTEIVGQYFVFRTLNRFEYKQLVAMQNIDPLQREEIIDETVIMWPSNYKWDTMATQKAGIPSTLAQIVMEKSGFVKDYAIQVL